VIVPAGIGTSGVDPLITGLVVIIMLGVTGQVAWFVYRKKRD